MHRVGHVSVTLTIRKYPDVLGSVSYRFSTQAIPGLEGSRAFTQRRVVSFDDITRALSGLEGQYEVPTWGVRLEDKDGLLRGLQADPTTNGIDQGRWEVTAEIRSEDGIAQNLDPVLLFRGIVTEATPEPGRAYSLQAKDILGGHLKGFDLDAPIRLPKLSEDFGDLVDFPEGNADLVASAVYGETMDHGTEDLAGGNAEKGLVPARAVGKTLIADGFPGTPGTGPVYLDQVTNLQVAVTGSGPTTSVVVGVSLMTEFGETPPTILVVANYPNPCTPSHFATWTWDLPVAYTDQIKYAVWYVGDRMTFPKYFLDGGGGTPYTPDTSYIDDGDDSHTKGYRHGPVTVNTAQVAEGDPGIPGSGPMFWDTYIVSVGVLNWDVVDFYGALLEGNGTTRRGLLDASTANSGLRNREIIAPGDTLWPHADLWIERNGRRYSGFYTRGERSRQAINGNVAYALNIGGYTATPDGTGLHFTQAGPVALHCLSNWWGLDPTTPTYTNGVIWNDLPRFANGDSKLQTSRFEQFQTDTAAAMFSLDGPQCRFVIATPMTLRDWFSKFSWTFYARWRVNHFGQLGPSRMPHGLSSTGTLYRDRIEVKHWLQPTIDRKVATAVTWVYDFDSELAQFRRAPQTIQDDDLVDANDGVAQTRETIEMPFTGDPETARCSAHYWLALFKKPRRFQPFEVSYRGLAKDLFDPMRLTHYDGLGVTGETGTQLLLDRHVVKASHERVVLTGLDLSTLAPTTVFNELEILPMVIPLPLGGSADAGLDSTSYTVIRGRIKHALRAADFAGYTLALRVQRWMLGSATGRWRLVDEDAVVLYESATFTSTTEYTEEEIAGGSFTLPTLRKDVWVEAKTTDAAVPVLVQAQLIATRN